MLLYYHLILKDDKNLYLYKNLYLSTYLPFPVLCIPLDRFEFPFVTLF